MNYQNKTVKYFDSRGIPRSGFVTYHDMKNGYVVLRCAKKNFRLCMETAISGLA